MINTGAALAFGLICLIVGFVGGQVTAGLNAAVKKERENYKKAVESRKAVAVAFDKLNGLLDRDLSALPKAVKLSPTGVDQRP